MTTEFDDEPFNLSDYLRRLEYDERDGMCYQCRSGLCYRCRDRECSCCGELQE